MPGYSAPSEAFLTALQSAHTAMKRGDKTAARQYAEKAREIDPQREEPLLVLAAMASPHASLHYLEQAIKINPQSQPARQGMNWALKRMPPTLVEVPDVRVSSQPSTQRPPAPHPEPAPQCEASRPAPVAARPAPAVLPLKARLAKLSSRRLSGLIMLVSILGLFAALFWVYQHGDGTLKQFVRSLSSPAQPQSVAQMPASALFPIPSALATPTPKPRWVATVTPLPGQEQPQPTPAQPIAQPPAASAPEEQPADATYTIRSGDTLSAIAVRYDISIQDLLHANNITNARSIHPNQTIILPGIRSNPDEPQSASPASSAKSIIVVLSEQTLYAFEGDKMVYNFSVSTGRNNTTLTGTFKINDKLDKPWSDPWGFWMPNWMGIYTGANGVENGIHALPIQKNGETLWGDAIGTQASYGCVVLQPESAATLYQWAERGTPVIIRE